MLRAIIFDFDGVIVDSEPLIMELTRRMAAREGWTVSEAEYYRDYLALNDRDIVEHLYRTHGRKVNPARRDELVRWKAESYLEAVRDGLAPVPGAPEFVRRRASQYTLAIASGSLRQEVEHLLGKLDLRHYFAVLATASECEQSKPDPCLYLMALGGLQSSERFGDARLSAEECLAIEDAPAGVDAAHAAGMKCIALAHSRPASELARAEWIFERFADVSFEEIAARF